MTRDEYRLSCYALARYQDIYRQSGAFNEEATRLIQEGMTLGQEELSFLEAMISHGPEYEEMDKAHCPILIYVGDPLCYGVLDAFGKSLGAELDKMGYIVEYYDVEANGLSGLADYVGKRFKAILGLQTYVFSALASDRQNLHDMIIGPKFNMILDHPVWLMGHLLNGPKDYHVLTHDDNYVHFVEKYYPVIKSTHLLPPAGTEIPGAATERKEFDISFVGSYHDWRLWKKEAAGINRMTGGIARRFMHYMIKHTSEPWETGLMNTLQLLGASEVSKRLSDTEYPDPLNNPDDFRQLLFEIKAVCFIVMSYYREKIMDRIVESGIKVHVFGKSWSQNRYKNVKSFIRHGDVTPEESLRIYARSKLSINIMSWHKAGMTERIANMMLNRTCVITDDSAYLTSQYTPGEDYLSIDLNNIDAIPGQIQSLLDDPIRQAKMTERAYEKASKKETWAERARLLSKIIESM